MSDKGFLKFDKETGLVVSSKQQILLDLINICKTSYGQDYVVDEGTEMYAFLDNLAFALSETGGAVKSLYDAFGFTMATGTPLDVLCSLAGISRKQGETDTQLRARYYTMLYTPSVSTLDGLKAQLMNATIEVNGTLYPIVEEVNILNNDTATQKTMGSDQYYTVDVTGHSICVICKLYANVPNYNENTMCKQLSDIILNYKSLGCGVCGIEGENLIYNNDSWAYTADSSGNPKGRGCYQVVIATPRALDISIKGSITFENATATDDEKDAIRNQIKENIIEYGKTLKMGQDIMYSAIMSAVYKMYGQLGYTEDILDISQVQVNSTQLSGQSSLKIGANRFPFVNSITIFDKTVYGTPNTN